MFKLTGLLISPSWFPLALPKSGDFSFVSSANLLALLPITWLGHSGDARIRLSQGSAITGTEALSLIIYNCCPTQEPELYLVVVEKNDLLTGDILFNTTLTLGIVTQVVKDQSWTPLAVSGVLLAAAIPGLTFGLIIGVFVDRYSA